MWQRKVSEDLIPDDPTQALTVADDRKSGDFVAFDARRAHQIVDGLAVGTLQRFHRRNAAGQVVGKDAR
ncbi:hypothetical protein F6X38_00230 [Aureimonas leprariae]|uniref:Uncharacterized protein n=1 Tax=Plantimonas leprariae TaxID=2615207 RepID=A0A7V7PSN6_9HYPH|nr:hypothetical protein F6X38_00230 [Aureimonas leprariae]